MSAALTVATAIAFITFITCVLILATVPLHGRFSTDSSFGVQKLHVHPTPRVGGVAVATGLVASFFLAENDLKILLKPTLLAAIPAFAIGLLEDITKKISVRVRLMATMFSGVLAWWLTGVSMQNTGVPPLDYALAFVPLAVVFTAFAVGGVANAVNIIDGFNGLAAGVVIIMLTAMGLIAYTVGDTAVAYLCLLVAACAFGFGMLNWPYGKIFLGDGGAYMLGFIVAWIAVLLPMRNPSITALTTLLACAYPVIEVGFSVLRRVKRRGHHPGAADKLHLHHLLHYRLSRPIFKGASCRVKNGMTSPFAWVCAALPATLSVLLSQNTAALCIAFLACVLLYSVLYRRLALFERVFVTYTTMQKTKTKLA